MSQILTEFDIVFRLCLAFAAGGIIGFERSSRRQVAGLRTHILITVGACCLMLLSIWLPQQLTGSMNADPGRIAAQVVTGMGFLGAGAIIRLGKDVKGLTTASSLWISAAIGMTMGAGMYVAALTSVILALITLMFLNKVERKIFPLIRNKILEVHYNHSNEPNTENALDIFKKYSIDMHSLSIYPGQGSEKKTRVRYQISILDSVDLFKFAKAFKLHDDVDNVEIKENH